MPKKHFGTLLSATVTKLNSNTITEKNFPNSISIIEGFFVPLYFNIVVLFDISVFQFQVTQCELRIALRRFVLVKAKVGEHRSC